MNKEVVMNQPALEDDVYIDREGQRLRLTTEPCRVINDALTKFNRARVHRDRVQESLDQLNGSVHDLTRRLQLEREKRELTDDMDAQERVIVKLMQKLMAIKPMMAIEVRRKFRDSGIPILDGYDRSYMPPVVRDAMQGLRLAYAHA